MSFKIYIDNFLTDDPVNSPGSKAVLTLLTTIRRENDKGGTLIFQDAKLCYQANNNVATGTISGYAYLLNLFETGICEQADIVIFELQDDGLTFRIFTGTVNVRSMSHDEEHLNITIDVQDNGFGAFIYNNRNIEYNLQSTKTKSKQNIVPPPIYNVDMFLGTTGVYGSLFGNLFRGYRLYDVFDFLTRAISDNRVTFASSFLQTLDPDIFVFTGLELLNPNTDPTVIISFGKLFDEIKKLKDISFFVDTNDPDAPILRLETTESCYSDAIVLDLPETILLLTTKSKIDRLYGTVKVGTEYNPGGSGPVYTQNAGMSYFGFKEETFTPIGQCNLDFELDLVNAFIISNNAIEDQLVGAVDGHEEDIFLVECENVDTGALTADAKRYNYYGVLPSYYLYNLGLNNASKMQAHGNNIQSAINNTQEIGGNGFLAGLGQDSVVVSISPISPVYSPSLTEPFVFADETTGNNYDGNNNYDNTTGVYVAPVTGNYSFNAVLNLSFENLKTCIGDAFNPVGFSTIGFGNQFGIASANYTGVTIMYGAVIRATLLVYNDNTLTGLPILSTTKSTGTFINGLEATLNINLAGTLQAGNAVVLRVEGQTVRVVTTGFNGNGQLVTFPNLIVGDVFGVSTGWNGSISGCSYAATEPPLIVVALEDSTFECNGTPDGGIVLSGNNSADYRPFTHEFSYGLSRSQWRSVVASPLGRIGFTKDGVTRYAHIEEARHDNETGETQFKLLSHAPAT